MKPGSIEMFVKAMVPGQRFRFRGQPYMRCAGPWEGGDLPIIDWNAAPDRTRDLYLAVNLDNGQLAPFFAHQQGEIEP